MVTKTRYSVTLTEPFIDGLKELVDRGLYLDNQDAIRKGLQNLFEKHGVKVFKDFSARASPNA
ncbi:unnamed protein product [marine sediment metagenome]|uniref:Ribbon-helix-helix protein CopG domain-containing protein n=1 Tax=marine sediment metagenome TaxID=412755 RepID=X1DTI9_9ZZZZ